MDIVSSIVSLATEIFRYINTENSRKYIDRLVKLQLELSQERARGDLSDDAKIESMYKEITIISEAARQDIMRVANTPKS